MRLDEAAYLIKLPYDTERNKLPYDTEKGSVSFPLDLLFCYLIDCERNLFMKY